MARQKAKVNKNEVDEIISLKLNDLGGLKSKLTYNNVWNFNKELVKEKKFVWVQGNCDAEVDEMVMKMNFKKRHTLHLPDHKVIFTHGHHLSRFDPDVKLNNGDVVVYGHYHVLNLTDNNGVTYLNIGSTSIPKDEHAQFAIFRDEVISVYDLDTMEPLLKLDLSV